MGFKIHFLQVGRFHPPNTDFFTDISQVFYQSAFLMGVMKSFENPNVCPYAIRCAIQCVSSSDYEFYPHFFNHNNSWHSVIIVCFPPNLQFPLGVRTALCIRILFSSTAGGGPCGRGRDPECPLPDLHRGGGPAGAPGARVAPARARPPRDARGPFEPAKPFLVCFEGITVLLLLSCSWL